MAGQIVPVPESVLAREVFAPLGGIVEIGAVAATGKWSVGAASVAALVSHRREALDRLLELIRVVADFSPSAMGVADELGYMREHQVTAPSLLLWSGAVAEIPPQIEDLELPGIVRRMCRMAADLQLTYFLQALITAAIVAEGECRRAAERITEVLEIACDLVGEAGGSSPVVVFKMWRVAHLVGILRPDSRAPESGKSAFRAYDQTLEELLASR